MKSFIYLDEYKMYSLSSQLMEGVTDYILKESKQSQTDNEQQKGPVASGRIIAEIIETASTSYEKKFLHDYAYSVFEDRLIETSRVTSIDSADAASNSEVQFKNSKIIRVKARAKFVDSKEIVKNLRSFEAITQSLGVVTSNGDREELNAELAELLGSSGNKKSEISRIQARVKLLSNPASFSDSTGNAKLYQKHLADVIEYGFKGCLDFTMGVGSFQITAELNRGNLRESEESIIKKYSRISEVEFVMLGVVTQSGANKDAEEVEITDDDSMRSAINKSINALSGFENSFLGRFENEIIVDPIAVYIEL